MADPWSILNLCAKTADRRAVKRAYAKKLKQCRPDENPQGFQILIQARDQALWLLKNLETLERHQEEGGDGQTHSQTHCGRSSQIESQDSELFTHQYFEKKLEDITSPSRDIWSMSYWEDFFNSLNQSDFSCRQDIEWLIIQLVGRRLIDTHNSSADQQQKEKILNVLVLLNEEFGWAQDDRKVYRVLGNTDADILLGLLRVHLHTGERLGVMGDRAITVPYIAIPDLRAYMGGDGEDIIQYYLKSWQVGQWGSALNFSGLLFGYHWRAWRGLWKMALIIGAMQMISVILLIGDMVTSPVLRGLLMVGCFAIPLFMVARYGQYLVVKGAYRAINQANDMSFASTNARYDYLDKQGKGTSLFTFLLFVLPVFSVLFSEIYPWIKYIFIYI